MRVKREQLETRIETLNGLLNRPVNQYTKHQDGSFTPNAGCIFLDYNPTYGGCVLREMTEGGGESTFGSTGMRVGMAEMLRTVNSMIFVINLTK